MLHIKHIEALKAMAELQVDIIESGVLYLFIQQRTIQWKVASQRFDMDIFEAGNNVSETAIAVQAMKEKRTITMQVPREKYGKSLFTVALPLMDDSGEAIGAFSIVKPRLHPVAASFPNFAPIVAELFPEGAFLYISDMTSISHIQSSRKFTLPGMDVGYELKETDMAYKTIHSGLAQTKALGPDRYGVPVYIANYPLFDTEGTHAVVATLGVVIPKSASYKLQEMSENLNENLTAIAQTVEHLALGASNISENELNLFRSVDSMSEVLNQINSVTEFIFSVSNQTNMLGLNASIEAARAGEYGRGFAVVANEIRNLATQSKDTVPKIRQFTEDIQSKIHEISDKSKQSLDSSEDQAAATQEISATLEDLSTMSEELLQLARDL